MSFLAERPRLRKRHCLAGEKEGRRQEGDEEDRRQVTSGCRKHSAANLLLSQKMSEIQCLNAARSQHGLHCAVKKGVRRDLCYFGRTSSSTFS